MYDMPVKLFIVEGEDRDYRFINEMLGLFFTGKYETRTICLPATQNIYMLYSQLKKDEFETDLVEVLRDNVQTAEYELSGISRQQIDEIYLFFDYDTHQDNLRSGLSQDEALSEMIDFFDNETDHGKLYLSYPMVEALYDYVEETCESYTGCYIPTDKSGEYKNNCGAGNPKASIHRDINEWKMIIDIFQSRLSCLFVREIDFETYRSDITTKSIYEKEEELRCNNWIFVLSGLPEFLLNYFRKPFWNSMIRTRRSDYLTCEKKTLVDEDMREKCI